MYADPARTVAPGEGISEQMRRTVCGESIEDANVIDSEPAVLCSHCDRDVPISPRRCRSSGVRYNRHSPREPYDDIKGTIVLLLFVID